MDIDIAIIGKLSPYKLAGQRRVAGSGAPILCIPCNAANINNHVKIIYAVRYDCLTSGAGRPLKMSSDCAAVNPLHAGVDLLTCCGRTSC